MKARLAFCIAAFFAMLAPAMAQDHMRGLAPADEYFGRYKLSVLGIANTIRDAQTRIDAGDDPRALFDGPLSDVSDAIHDWEHRYPSDPWIAKDLLALETVYLHSGTDEGTRRAHETEGWLVADYPNSDQAVEGRSQLATDDIPYMPQPQPRSVAQQPAYAPGVLQPQPYVGAQASAPPPVYVQAPPIVVQQPVVVQAPPVVVRQAIPSYAIPWERYAAMRRLPPWAR